MEKKEKIELIVTIGLVAVLILVSFNSCLRVRKKLGKPSGVSAAAPSLPVTISPKPSPVVLAEEIKEDAEWGRCPFSGKPYSGQPQDQVQMNLRLTGIIWDEINPQALIGDEFVKEGSAIGLYQVIKIKKDRVILSDGSKDFELRLE